MMRQAILLLTFVLFLTLSQVNAFAPTTSKSQQVRQDNDRMTRLSTTTTTTSLASSTAANGSSSSSSSNKGRFTATTRIQNEDEARELLTRAKAFAFAENHQYGDVGRNLQEAKWYLREMIHLQSGCVTGALIGNDICNEQDVAAMVVAQLRYKIQQLEKLEHLKHPHSSPPSSSVVPMIATELSLGAMMIVVAIFWTTMDMSLRQGEDFIAPHNIHDWWAAFTQMGYLSFL